MTTIGKEKRKFLSSLKLSLPGVGAYNLEEMQFRKTKGGRFNRATRSITQANQTSYSSNNDGNVLYSRPGPGSYSVQIREKKRVISFPHSRRFHTDKSMELPGPGLYKTEECSKEKIKAGFLARSQRITSKQIQKSPGPSDYLMPSVSSYKKKEPIPLAKRSFHSTQYEESAKRFNEEKDLYQKYQASHRTNRGGTERGGTERGVKMDRAWHGKKIEKQAKRVQKDQPLIPS